MGGWGWGIRRAAVTLAARTPGGAALLRDAQGLDGAENLTRAQINEVCPCPVAKQWFKEHSAFEHTFYLLQGCFDATYLS